MSSSFSDEASIIIEQFNTFFRTYRRVAPYLNLDENIKRYIDQREGWIVRLEQEEFPVAFFGSFSAGKSTIINAILGKEVLPEAPQSTTAFPTILRKSEGTTDEVFIYYINEQAKSKLWNQLSSKIGHKIDKNLDKQHPEDYPSHLGRIRDSIQEYRQTHEKFDTRPFKALQQLSQGWDKDKYKASVQPISLSDLKNYVEGHEDSIFIDRIEVNLLGIDMPRDIILVDLPGLGVVNQRHVEFTKTYIQQKAKAFVVCMKPNSLLEGEELEFLEEISRTNPTILQRSFWIINQWDKLNDQQKQQEEENFSQKVEQYGFTVTRERFFKFSALNHLLLACIVNGTINQTRALKDHITSLTRYANDPAAINPDQARNLLKGDEVKPFSDFCEALFNYLNEIAKGEFIEDARRELRQIIRNSIKLLKPLYEQQYSQDADLAAEFRVVEANNRLNDFTAKLEDKVKHFVLEVRNSKNVNFWGASDTQKVEAEIKSRVSSIDIQKLYSDLRTGTDIEGNLSRLPATFDKEVGCTLPLLLRNSLVSAIESIFIQRLSKLCSELKQVDIEYLPESILEMLEDKLGDRDITMRLNGLADSLFYKYGEELERIGLSLNECQGESLEQRVDAALKKYSDDLIQFTKNLVNDLGRYTRRSFKNHAEYLEQELLQTFDTQRDIILVQIARKVRVSESVRLEEQKRNAVKSTYSLLVNLNNAL